MRHVRIFAAVPIMIGGIVLAGATHASARAIDPELQRHEPVVVVHEPGPVVPVDDAAGEARQAGAAALGGACVALGAVWIHRRRHPSDPYEFDPYEADDELDTDGPSSQGVNLGVGSQGVGSHRVGIR
jgi:hypothetical protein